MNEPWFYQQSQPKYISLLFIHRGLRTCWLEITRPQENPVSEDQEDCVRSVVKKVKEDNAIKWNKVGNEKQLKLNESLEAKFDSSIAFIKREWSFSLAFIDKKKLNKAKQELEEGKKL